MEKKKGFTLIELLAVIVILAIIALIATPIVLNLINTARKGAFARSAEGVLNASKLYYSSNLVEDITPNKNTFTCNNKECLSTNGAKLDVDGNMGSGNVTIKEDGKIFFTLTDNKYCAVKYEANSKVVVKKGNCSNIDLTNDTTPPVIKNVTVNTTTNSITIVVSAEDNESGIHHYEYSIDGGQTYEEENTNTKTFKNLEKKDYKIKVKVYNGTYGKDNYNDNTGMTEYEVKDLVQLKDMDLPEIKVTPEEWSISKTVEIDYKGALVQEYSLDGGTTFIKYEGPFTITENITIVAKASDGTNSVTNSSNITKIDTEKPTISIKAVKKTANTVVNGDTWSDETLVYTLTKNTEGASGSTIYYCKDTNNTCNPNIPKESVDITDTGIYYIRYKSVSGSGVESDIDSYKAKVDTIAPTASYNLESGVYNESKTITITADDSNYWYMDVHVYKDGGVGTGTFVEDLSKNWITDKIYTIALKDDGVYYVYAMPYDYAGNVTTIPQVYKIMKDKTYSYTGSVQTFVAPVTGTYKIELWGAQGGSMTGTGYRSDGSSRGELTYIGGKGAYTTGTISFRKGTSIYLYIGGKGNCTGGATSGYNGGGTLSSGQCTYGAPGGGATDIRLTDGVWDNFNSLKSRIMVAAGGGGANFRNQGFGEGNGGDGGSLIGINGYEALGEGSYFRIDYDAGYQIGSGATQKSGGYAIVHYLNGTIGEEKSNAHLGFFGYATQIGNQTGGGSGYYGGGSNGHGGAGGGSSFISGYDGCDAIAEISTENNIIHTGQSVHYSGYKFNNTMMYAGNEEMPTHDGTSTMIGNSGNGYAKITLVQ